MPGEHKEIYISTTLAIVIFTTVVCGGLTEPMLNKMGMKLSVNADQMIPMELNHQQDHAQISTEKNSYEVRQQRNLFLLF